MAYYYNRHRRKRVQSELSLAQMLQTVLNDVAAQSPVSGAYFAYSKEVYSIANDADPTPVTTVRPGTWSATGGLPINTSTGEITLGSSSEGSFDVTIDIGNAPKQGEPSGTFTQTISIIRD